MPKIPEYNFKLFRLKGSFCEGIAIFCNYDNIQLHCHRQKLGFP